jgi:hypothetical protein
MTTVDAMYVLMSLLWALYGLVVGFGIGLIARMVWAEIKRR